MARTSSHGQTMRSYTGLQIALHWLTVVLIFGQWYTSAAIPRTHSPLLPPSESDLFQHAIHTYAGLLIGMVMVVRFILGYVNRIRRPSAQSGLKFRLVSIVHAALYLAVLCQVTTGVITSYLWAPARVFHTFSWDVLLILASIHVAAAFYHLIRGDDALRRMIPWLP